MPSVIQADLLKDASATKTLATLSSSAVSLHSDVVFPSGHIIQTKFVAFDQQQTIGNGSDTGQTFVLIGSGVSGKEFSIDMAVSSGNKIIGFGTVNLNANGRYTAMKIYSVNSSGTSTQIALGQSNGSMARVTTSCQLLDETTNQADQYVMKNSSFCFSHTPSDTNTHSYKIYAGNTYDSARITYINRPWRDDTSSYMHSGYSHFMLMEIAQ
jgi:hypothetical protein